MKLDWQELAFGAWNGFLKPILQKLVLQTDNKWDDAAVEGIDNILKRVIGPENLEDAKVAMEVQ